MSLRKGFDSTVLPELSPFQIDTEVIVTEDRVSADGKGYKVFKSIIKPKNVDDTFEVETFKRDFDRMRVLQYLKPTGYLNATWKMKTSENAYDTLIFSGVEPGESK